MGCRDICPVLGEDLTEQHIVRDAPLCVVVYVESVLLSFLHSCSRSVIFVTTTCGV